MKTKTKPWQWETVKGSYEDKWKTPADEAYYLVHRWHNEGVRDILDLGCGIGRHSILFAENGFNTHGMDLSKNAVERADQWSKELGLDIDFKVGDMLSLPYEDQSMDALFAYYVITHTDTKGVIEVLKEIKRVLKSRGEAYLTFGSKDSWGFKMDWPIVDENTKLRIEDGPDNNVPHFYADPELLYRLLNDFDIIDLKQIQKIEKKDDKIKTHNHYHVLVKKREND